MAGNRITMVYICGPKRVTPFPRAYATALRGDVPRWTILKNRCDELYFRWGVSRGGNDRHETSPVTEHIDAVGECWLRHYRIKENDKITINQKDWLEENGFLYRSTCSVRW